MTDNLSLSKEYVLITGAGQRLGFHCARALLELGHKVAITYRQERESVQQLRDWGANCIYADFSTDEGIIAGISAIKAQVKGLTTLVHNASTWSSDEPEKLNDIFDSMMQIHAKAPYLLNHHLHSHFCETLTNIVHISDFVADVGSTKHTAYAASKAALDNLTLSFARKWAPKVRVNSIAPSMIVFNDDDDDAYKAKTLKKSLLGIEPGEKVVTDTLLYLLQNNYITGEIISLNGGRHLNLP